ncbi:hypothetical protein [Paenibacillus apis]|uniref:Uncharacterized protein n=1 Tax=Paenibacillus apis TaxID=1792174 RepID=A0A919Y0T5_9BACL|nr:hypothetical protein [Paenibacillus apis]GIO42499.1 hypothetical protein J41TS4_22570 [Paenibacillus apis]
MTKQVRDWNKDMKLSAELHAIGSPLELEEIAIYWMNQYAAEKERADKAEYEKRMLIQTMLKGDRIIAELQEDLQAAEAREKKLRETLEFIKGITTKAPAFSDSAYAHFEACETLSSLYPKEEEGK